MCKGPKPFCMLGLLSALLWACPETESAPPTPAPSNESIGNNHGPCMQADFVCPPPFECQEDGSCLSGQQVFIPAGEYPLGCNDDDNMRCMPRARPTRLVQSRAFAMDRFEVSVSNYAQCVQAGVCTAPTCSYQGNDPVKVRCNWQRPDSQDHPINGLTHAQAQAYCAHKKMRLPTDDEWEIAARGPKGRPFPWGNAMIGPSQQSLANIADRNAKFRWGWPSIHGVDDGWAGTAPVGSYPKGQSPFGVMDLIGNVWEWTATAQGPDKIRIRGAGYANHGFYLQASSWDEKPLTTAEPYLGFRCVRSMVQAAP